MNTPETEKKKSLMTTFKKKEVQDYTYAILFLLISSFFAFFVIRPVLGIAVSLRREGQDLERINAVYEENITKVLQLQADLELVRTKTHLLDEAVPQNPNVDALIEDIRKIAQDEKIDLEGVTIQGLQLKGDITGGLPTTPNQLYAVAIDISINGNYDDATTFVRALSQQRRIKTIKSIDIAREKDAQATSSASTSFVKLKMSVQAYYL